MAKRYDFNVFPSSKENHYPNSEKAGHTTAMTGDVNDILALREADCSIVMAEGDPSDCRLLIWFFLKLDFNDVLRFSLRGVEVNNIAHIAPILIKTIYLACSHLYRQCSSGTV